MVTRKQVKGVRIRARIDPERWGGSTTEGFWGTPLESGLYRLDNVPFYADSLAFHDVVRCDLQDGELIISGVQRRSGNSTVRMVLAESARDPTSIASIENWLDASGLEYENSGEGLFGISVESSERLHELLAELAPQRSSGVINFEVSYRHM